MRRETALGLVIVVFLVGLASGLLGSRLLHRHPVAARGGPMSAPHLRELFLRGNLDLTAKQQTELKEIFRRRRQEIDRLHRNLRPEVEQLMEQIHREVEAVLTPEQRTRYRANRRRERRGTRRFDHPEMHRRRPPPPPESEDP